MRPYRRRWQGHRDNLLFWTLPVPAGQAGCCTSWHGMPLGRLGQCGHPCQPWHWIVMQYIYICSFPASMPAMGIFLLPNPYKGKDRDHADIQPSHGIRCIGILEKSGADWISSNGRACLSRLKRDAHCMDTQMVRVYHEGHSECQVPGIPALYT